MSLMLRALGVTGLALIALSSPLAAQETQESGGAPDSAPAEAPRPSRPASRNNAFLPGLSWSWLVPFEDSRRYQGANFHYAFIQGVTSSRNSSDFGGYYETYAEIGFYKEQNSSFSEDIFFQYSLGVNLSFEKFLASSRTVLVPYFGARAGGLYLNDPNGSGEARNGLLLEPVLGAVVFLTPWFNLNYDAALFLNTVDLPGLIGVRHSVVLNVNL